MEVTFYTFSKKINSTKIPNSGGQLYNCLLKADCSVINPTLLMNFGVIYNPTGQNYCYIKEFERYYYVEWQFIDGLWEANCSVDVMASNRTEIGVSNLYLLRAANAYDTTIEDTLFPATTQVFKKAIHLEAPWLEYKESNWGPAGGMYVIGVMGNSSAAITYYAFTRGEFQHFCSKFYSTSWWEIDWNDVIGISEDILKTLFNPIQYINSCKWYPLTGMGSGGTVVNNIPLGWWAITDVRATKVEHAVIRLDVGQFALPRNPQAKTRGDYLYFEPYSQYYLYTRPFGNIKLDRAYFRNELVKLDIIIDTITGEAELRIWNVDDNDNPLIIDTYKTEFAVDIPILQIDRNYGAVFQAVSDFVGSYSTIKGTVADAFTKGDISTGIKISGEKVQSGIENVVSALTPKMTSINLTSSFDDFIDNDIQIYTKYALITDENREVLGKTLCSTRNVASLGGYMLPAKADINLKCSMGESETVKSIMLGGFYYE